MHILTFDIEDWFHIFDKSYYRHFDRWDNLTWGLEDNMDKICRFLEEKNIKATFFWLGWVAFRCPELLKRISDLGHEIGVHSFYHIRLNDLTEKQFRENTSKAVNTIEEITGKKVTAYRAPGMSISESTLWAFDILRKLGIEEDSSLVTGQRITNVKIPDKPFVIEYNGLEIKEFPINSIRIPGKSFNYSGSGYFRITPYWFLHRKMIDAKYIMSYFHPRDFDIDVHKAIKNSPFLKLKYRLGAKGAYHKLERLSKNINWISIQEASKHYDWENAERIAFK